MLMGCVDLVDVVEVFYVFGDLFVIIGNGGYMGLFYGMIWLGYFGG